MTKYKKIFFFLLFAGASLTASSEEMDLPTNVSASESKEKTMSLKVTINQVTEVKMENIPTTGNLEVYSILGVRVKSINLKTCVDDKSCSIDLNKGVYILKAGKVAQKVIVK